MPRHQTPGRRRSPLLLPACVLLFAVALAWAGASAAMLASPRHGAYRPEAQASSLTLTWVGDITPGSYMGLTPGDGRGLYASQRKALRAADVAVGNLEGTLGEGGAAKCGAAGNGGTCFAFQAPARYARGLKAVGFDMLNMANNHAMDFGPVGFSQTIKALREHGMRRTGAPGQIAVLRRRGVRIAFVGFAAYRWANDINDLAGARALVQQARRRAQIVVVGNRVYYLDAQDGKEVVHAIDREQSGHHGRDERGMRGTTALDAGLTDARELSRVLGCDFAA